MGSLLLPLAALRSPFVNDVSLPPAGAPAQTVLGSTRFHHADENDPVYKYAGVFSVERAESFAESAVEEAKGAVAARLAEVAAAGGAAPTTPQPEGARGGQGQPRVSPHRAARLLRPGSLERDALLDAVYDPVPSAVAKPPPPEFPRPPLFASQEPDDDPETPRRGVAVGDMVFLNVSRAATLAAAAQLRSKAVADAAVDAAGKSIAALEEARRIASVDILPTQVVWADPALEKGGVPEPAPAAAAASAYAKALYAAVRCVARWADLCAEAPEAESELARAQRRLDDARGAAEAIRDRIARGRGAGRSTAAGAGEEQLAGLVLE